LYVTGQNAITTLTLQGTQPVADLDVFAVTCEGSAATVILPAGGVHSSLGVSQLADGTTELNVQTTTSAEPISVVIPVEQHAYFWFVSAERDPVYAGWHYASSSVYSGAAFPADIALQDTYIAPLFYPGVDTPTTVRQVGATDLGTPSRTFRDLYLSGQITAGGGGDVQALGLRRAVDVLDYAELQLSYAPLPVESLTLTVNGCVQTPDVDYTVDGTSVTWLALDFTLADDDKIIATYTRA
jgi:hypothetical protein